MNKKIITIVFLSLLSLCMTANAMELAIIQDTSYHPNEGLPYEEVIIIDDWGNEYKYYTDSDGSITCNLTEGYYMIIIDGGNSYSYDNETYLNTDRLNVIKVETGINGVPGFEIVSLLSILAIITMLLIIYRKIRR